MSEMQKSILEQTEAESLKRMVKKISNEASRAKARQKMKKLYPDLKSDQVIHHIDGNPQNNALTNLTIMSVSAHSSLHGRLKLIEKASAQKIIRLFVYPHKRLENKRQGIIVKPLKKDLVRSTFWIRRDQNEAIRQISEREERSIAVLVRKALDQLIEERKEE